MPGTNHHPAAPTPQTTAPTPTGPAPTYSDSAPAAAPTPQSAPQSTPQATAPAPFPVQILATLALSLSLIVLDGTIVGVCLPVIISDLGLDLVDAQWVNSLYAVVFAALLLSAGALGDRIGRRRLLLGGLFIFLLGSALAAAAQNASYLIAARGIQGIGGAAVLPATLSSTNAIFRGQHRARAFGIWGATMASMAAIGPLAGGWLATEFSWRWIFLVNLPLGVALLVATWLTVPETSGPRAAAPYAAHKPHDHAPTPQAPATPASADTTPPAAQHCSTYSPTPHAPTTQPTRASHFDFFGLIFSAAGFGLLVFALIEGTRLGWWQPKAELRLGSWTWSEQAPISPVPLALAVGLVLTLLFLKGESCEEKYGWQPILRLSLFRISSFTWGNLAAAMVATAEFALVFVLPLFLVNVLGLNTLHAGWVLAAMAGGALLSGALAHRLAARWGSRRVVIFGLILEAAGVFGAAWALRPDFPPALLAALLALYGLGMGLAAAQLTSTVLAEVPLGLSGMGSATQSTLRQLGSALGSAVAGSALAGLLAQILPTALPQTLSDTAAQDLTATTIDSAGGILPALSHSPANPLHQPSVLSALGESFTAATAGVMYLSFAFLLIALLATIKIPTLPPKASY